MFISKSYRLHKMATPSAHIRPDVSNHSGFYQLILFRIAGDVILGSFIGRCVPFDKFAAAEPVYHLVRQSGRFRNTVSAYALT